MFSNYRLLAELTTARKIKSITNSAYKIKIKATGRLEIEFGCYAERYYTAAHEVASFLLDVDNTNIDKRRDPCVRTSAADCHAHP